MEPKNPNVGIRNLDITVLMAVYASVAALQGTVVGICIYPSYARVAWQREDGPYAEKPYVVHYFNSSGHLFSGEYDLTEAEAYRMLKGL